MSEITWLQDNESEIDLYGDENTSKVSKYTGIVYFTSSSNIIYEIVLVPLTVRKIRKC